MAEVNPDLARLTFEALKHLHIEANTSTSSFAQKEHAERINDKVDTFGAAFQRLYALIAASK